MKTEINRPLDEDEKAFMCALLVVSISEQTGVDKETVRAALGDIAETGKAVLRWDAVNAYLVVAGKPLIHCERDWLAWHAHATEWESVN